jgi:hypothetical protein
MTTIKRFFFSWQFAEAEQWLNEKSAEGLHLIGTGTKFRWFFEEGEPNEYIYRIEISKDSPKGAKNAPYLALVAETGAELVSSRNGLWIAFRKRSSDGEFELFSDLDSKIAHLKRFTLSFLPIGIGCFCSGLSNIVIGLTSDSGVINIFNSAIGVFCVLVSSLLLRAHYTVQKKINRLKRERKTNE